MHRLNLLRPQEKQFVCLFVWVFFFFFSGKEPIVFFFFFFFFFSWSALSHIQRKERYCDIFSSWLVCYCLLLWWWWDWRERGWRRRHQKVFVCKLGHICWFFFFCLFCFSDPIQTTPPDTESGDEVAPMAIRKSVKKHWLCEANSQFALFSVSLVWDPKAVLDLFSHYRNQQYGSQRVAVTHIDHLGSVLSYRKEGWGGALAIIWSRLRWSSSLSKVL